MTGSVNRAFVLLCRCSTDHTTPHDISHVSPGNVLVSIVLCYHKAVRLGRWVKVGGGVGGGMKSFL